MHFFSYTIDPVVAAAGGMIRVASHVADHSAISFLSKLVQAGRMMSAIFVSGSIQTDWLTIDFKLRALVGQDPLVRLGHRSHEGTAVPVEQSLFPDGLPSDRCRG